MKNLSKLILMLALVVAVSSCQTVFNPPTKYQGKNLTKFNKRKHTYGSSKKRGMSKRNVAFKKRQTYWHPAVTDGTRRYLRARTWMEVINEGQRYK